MAPRLRAKAPGNSDDEKKGKGEGEGGVAAVASSGEAKVQEEIQEQTFVQRYILLIQLSLALAAAGVSLMNHAMQAKDEFRFMDSYKDPGAWYAVHAPKYENITAGWNYTLPAVVAGQVKARHANASVEVAGLSILEVGSGSGLVGRALAAHGYPKLVGADISPEMAAEARRTDRYSRLVTVDIDQVTMAGLDTPAAFDLILCVGTAGYLGRESTATRTVQRKLVRELLREWLRLLRPGGILAISVETMFAVVWDVELDWITEEELWSRLEVGEAVAFMPGHPESWLQDEESRVHLYQKSPPKTTPA